jgi:hypothetical protein
MNILLQDAGGEDKWNRIFKTIHTAIFVMPLDDFDPNSHDLISKEFRVSLDLLSKAGKDLKFSNSLWVVILTKMDLLKKRIENSKTDFRVKDNKMDYLSAKNFVVSKHCDQIFQRAPLRHRSDLRILEMNVLDLEDESVVIELLKEIVKSRKMTDISASPKPISDMKTELLNVS